MEVGAVSNIIDLVSKTINSIRDLRGRWKEADLAFLSLAAQLTALRAALTKIQEWSNNELSGDLDYQLIMDLDVSMSCCRLLVGKFDDFFFKLDQTTDEPFDFAGKVKFVFGTRELENVQKMVERQIGALTLLLTACNCKTTSEQKTLLRDSKTRKVIGRVELDSASLFVHRDSSSFISRWSDNLSKFSIRFDFDRELFVTKVYEKVFRGSVKDSLLRQHGLTRQENNKVSTKQQTPAMSREEIQAKRRSQAIDRTLEEDSRRLRRECKVLLLGTAESGKGEIVKQMKIIHQNGYTRDELIGYRYTIHRNVIDCAKALVEAIKMLDIRPESDVNSSYYNFLLDYTVDPDPDVPLKDTVGEAIDALWKDPFIAEVLESSDEFYLMDSAPYFFKEIRRIAAPDYIPTEADVLRSRTRTTSVYETRFLMSQLSIHLIDVGGQRSERKKWIHQFDNVTSIIFVVDLACYDQVLLEESSQNAMMEQLVLFDSVVNSRWFMHTSIILFLSNISVFRQKLARNPLRNYFPDYSGGNDVNRAAKYLLWRFNQVNRAHLNLYPHLTDPNDTTNIRSVFAAIKETILQNALRNGATLSF